MGRKRRVVGFGSKKRIRPKTAKGGDAKRFFEKRPKPDAIGYASWSDMTLEAPQVWVRLRGRKERKVKDLLNFPIDLNRAEKRGLLTYSVSPSGHVWRLHIYLRPTGFPSKDGQLVDEVVSKLRAKGYDAGGTYNLARYTELPGGYRLEYGDKKLLKYLKAIFGRRSSS